MAREALKRSSSSAATALWEAEVLKRLSTVPTVQAISVSRRGAAPSHCAAFADKVDWRTGDCLDKRPTPTPSRGASARRRERGEPTTPR